MKIAVGGVCAAMAALNVQAAKFKFGVLSDLHLQTKYRPNISPDSPDFCTT